MFLIDGEARDRIDARDRGLAYGDGLFETIAVDGGVPLLWERHVQRLTWGCERLGLPLPDPALLAAETRHLCREADRAVLKLILTRGSGGRGYRPPQPATTTRILGLHPWPDYPAAWREEGVRVRICDTRLAVQPALAGLKHLNRLEQVLARREWDDPAIAEGLMLDTAGRVVEGTFTNLFLVRDGVLRTPELSGSGVAGIMRDRVLETADGLGLPRVTGAVTLDDMAAAEEVFLTNTLIGIWPVQAIDERPYPVGDHARTLAAELRRCGTFPP